MSALSVQSLASSLPSLTEVRVINPVPSTQQDVIDFCLAGHEALGVPLSLCESGLGVGGGGELVSLIPSAFPGPPPCPDMLQIMVTWTGYRNDRIFLPIPKYELTLQELAKVAADSFRTFYEEVLLAYKPSPEDALDKFRLGPNCAACYDNISLRRMWFNGAGVWILELSFVC